MTRHSQSITCKVLLEPRYSNYENKLTNISKTFIQNFVDLPAEHPEDNEIIIPLWKRKLKSKTEASVLSLHVSAIRLCSRRKDYQSRTETTAYIILTTTNPVQPKAKNCCEFKCILAYVGKTWSDCSWLVKQNVLKEMFVLMLIAKTGAP